MQDASLPLLGSSSPLSPTSFHSLSQLNLLFLRWATARAKQPASMRDLQLPWDLQQNLARLSYDQCVTLSHCPYALFDMKFEDEEYWLSCLQGNVQPRVADGPSIDPHTRDFAQLAMFYTWHLAVSDPVTAQCALGIREQLLYKLRELGVDRLPLVAASQAQRLRPRWLSSARYWRDLIAMASKPGSEEFHRVKLFGFQLSAAAYLIAERAT